MSFCNQNESFGIIFYAALLAWPPISPLIKPRDRTKKFQQKAIQFHGTFYSLKIRLPNSRVLIPNMAIVFYANKAFFVPHLRIFIFAPSITSKTSSRALI